LCRWLQKAQEKGISAGEVLFAALKAEAAKLFLAGLLLWFVLALYQESSWSGCWVVCRFDPHFSMALFAGDKP